MAWYNLNNHRGCFYRGWELKSNYIMLIRIIGISRQAIELLLLISTIFGINPIKVATIKIKMPINPEK